MAAILIVHGARAGETDPIVAYIADSLTRRGAVVRPLPVQQAPSTRLLEDVRAVIVGAAVQDGHHHRPTAQWVALRRADLARRPSAFFSVNLDAGLAHPKARARAAGYLADFVSAGGWQPAVVGLFGGVLPYTQYGAVKRALLSRAVGKLGGPTDSSCDHELTDWQAVARFVEQFSAILR